MPNTQFGLLHQDCPHLCDCVPEAAPQAEAYRPVQIFGPEATLLKVRFRAAIYFIVPSRLV